MILSKVVLSLLSKALEYRLSLLGIKVKNTLTGLIINKVIKKACMREKEYSIGDMITLSTTDVVKFSTVAGQCIKAFTLPLSLLQGLVALYLLMGPSCLIGVAVVFFVVIMNLIITPKFIGYNRRKMNIQDRQTKTINECFGNIRYVKMTATEEYFLKRLVDIKEEGIKLQKEQNVTIVW
jgi:ATP-binding cassette subfamily C (CFTR/MRP) protein 1